MSNTEIKIQSKSLTRCSNCGLPLKMGETSRESEPVCDICLRYKRRWADHDYEEAFKEFTRIIDHYQSKGSNYDCIVPISGGKDSTYVLHYLRKVMKLNTLAVNYDNGFQTKEAYMNLKYAVEKTGSAYISIRPPWDKLKMLYKSYTLQSGGDICGTCNMGVSHAVYKIADAEKVPLIIWGYSSKHENTPIYEGKRYCREKMYRNAIQNTEAAKYFDLLAYDHFKRRNKLLSIYMFNYIPYDEQEIISTLKNEYGWQAASHGTNKADCDIFKVSNYYKIKQNGYGRINIKFSALVRDGQIKKEDALKLINEREKNLMPEETESVLDRIDLISDDVQNAKGRRLDFVDSVNNKELFQELKDSSGSIEERSALLINYVEPEVQRDGGKIELIKVDDDFLYFKLGGDCRGCFLQQVMTNYIDTLLVRFIPELKGSIPVYDLN